MSKKARRSCNKGLCMFLKRLLCRHDFKSLDVYGRMRICRKCGKRIGQRRGKTR